MPSQYIVQEKASVCPTPRAWYSDYGGGLPGGVRGGSSPTDVIKLIVSGRARAAVDVRVNASDCRLKLSNTASINPFDNNNSTFFQFLPRNAMHRADYAVARRFSVCLSVCHTPALCLNS